MNVLLSNNTILHIFFNADTLFNDIANLAELALKERKKQEKYILKELTKIK